MNKLRGLIEQCAKNQQSHVSPIMPQIAVDSCVYFSTAVDFLVTGSKAIYPDTENYNQTSLFHMVLIRVHVDCLGENVTVNL